MTKSLLKITHLKSLGGYALQLGFSDGAEGTFDATELLRHEGALLTPLRDPSQFATCFIELGALCWPNGLELSAKKLYQDMQQAGNLSQARKAA
jgi:hypothetical protein